MKDRLAKLINDLIELQGQLPWKDKLRAQLSLVEDKLWEELQKLQQKENAS